MFLKRINKIKRIPNINKKIINNFSRSSIYYKKGNINFEAEEGKTYYLCKCEKSENYPFCDGQAHEGVFNVKPLKFVATKDSECTFIKNHVVVNYEKRDKRRWYLCKFMGGVMSLVCFGLIILYIRKQKIKFPKFITKLKNFKNKKVEKKKISKDKKKGKETKNVSTITEKKQEKTKTQELNDESVKKD